MIFLEHKLTGDQFCLRRYEAATIIKNTCLKDTAVGDILQLLHLAISVKKWIIHGPSGWQPVSITLPESNPESEW